MKKIAVLLLLWASPIWAATVTLPTTLAAKPGRLIKITATTDGKVVRWINGSLDADLIPMESGLSAIFSSPNPGKYLIYAYTAAADVPSEPAQCLVVVGDPGPGPAPPIPPAPPVPPPPAPPGPLDPLVGKLSVAYGLETDVNKETLRVALGVFYKQGAVLVTDTTLTTWGDVFKQMSSASKTLGLFGKLPEVQKVLALELNSKLPTTASTPLDSAGRQLAAKTFLAIASAIDNIK